MEVVLEAAEGMPEGGVLSIKVGETKRQAPASKIGQAFRFASSPAEPLPLQVELFTPAAPPQLVSVAPGAQGFEVHFGHRMKVQLSQREAPSLQRPLVDVAGAVEAKGVPLEKQQMAQKAASYLEEHDLVRTFQEMLHGLLVAKPRDPIQYMEERLARAKTLMAARQAAAGGPPPQDSAELAAAKERARAALEKAVMEEDEDSPELAGAKERARAALEKAVMEEDEDSPELAGAKERARAALEKAVMEEDEREDSPELAGAKERAQAVLERALDEDLERMDSPETTGAKERARAVLEAAVLEDPQRLDSPETTGAKQRAQAVLEKAVLEDPSAGPAPRRSSQARGSTGSVCRGKVESLFAVLQAAHENLGMVLPLLPKELRELVTSDGFESECKDKFRGLDVGGRGTLAPADLLPVIVELTQAKTANVTMEQCRRFCGMFDSNDDGVICRGEFVELVRFVVAAGFLESEEGQATIQLAKVEESMFEDFIRMLEADKERLWTILPFLPAWLVEHVTGEAFQKACNEQFEKLDVDKSGALEPHELVSVVRSLSEAHPLVVDVEKCRRFARVFDVHNNGVILRDEFLEFAQFLTVMNYLSTTEEGKEVKQRAALESNSMRLARYIDMLRQDPTRMNEVLHHVPQALALELGGEDFREKCLSGFVKLDKDRNGVLDPAELYPVICALNQTHSFCVTAEQCRTFTAIFDQDRNGVICQAEFPSLARYITLMGYLQFTKDHEDLLVQEVLMGRERLQGMIEAMRAGVGQVQDLVPFLPQELINELNGPEFEAQCMKDFADLDKDKSGVLEPRELIPVILHLSEAHDYALTEDHCKRFVDIFDVKRNGVITREEYIRLTRFIMVMAFMETEGACNDDELLKRKAGRVEGQKQVEELLEQLEHDRQAVQKVVPMLPTQVYEDLTSDRFVMECHAQFEQLDKDKAGFLLPRDVFPIIVEMSQAHPYAVTMDQCQRFTQIFDLDGNGALQKDEFLDFTRFLCIMSYIHTPEGKEALKDALPIMNGSKKIEELIATMARDRANMKKVIPFLPDWFRQELLSEHFTVECLDFFTDLDQDRNGILDPKELFPMVLALGNVHHLSLDMAQCKRFTAIFDDAGTGVISKSEFVDFSRFLLIMGYLNSQEGQQVLSASLAQGGERTARPGEQGAEGELSPEDLKAQNTHLSLDCEIYQGKAARLESENTDLRRKLGTVEDVLRQMQAKMDEQEIRLRHAEVRLRSSNGLRG